MFRGILDNVLSGMKAGFKAILNLEHPFERKKMDTQKGSSKLSAIVLTLTLMVTAFWVSPAAAQKYMVKDPSTGAMITAPEYGGTLTTVINANHPDHGDTWLTHAAGVIVGAALDKLGTADWTTDRSVSQFTTYWPESILRGHLAESWENPDPLTYIYTIRDNVFFHDKPPVNGRQLTADDMAANYERLLGIGRFAGQERSPVGSGTVLIPIESVTATDELTFEIKLSQPLRDAHQRLFDDPHIYARPPETFDTLDDANNVIGTGPFIMDEFVSGTSVTFARNPNYWKDDEKFPGNRLPYVDKLVMLVMGDEATRLAALRSAQVDFTGGNGTAQIKSISSVLDLQKTNPDMQLFPFAFRSEVSSPINICAGGPLSDVRVRHALQMAIDLETINDNYFSGFGEWKPMGPIGPAWVGYHNAFDTWPEELKKFYSYNPEGAERLLDEAGYPRGADGVRLRTQMWRPVGRSDIGYHELEVGYWKEIGVEVELNALEDASFFGKISSRDWDGLAMWWSNGADYNTLDGSLGAYTSEGPIGGAYCDPVFDARWEELQAAINDEDEYRRLAKPLDMYAIEQHVYIWGPRAPSFSVAQPWIVGYNGEMQVGNAGWTLPYARIWVDSQLKAELN